MEHFSVESALRSMVVLVDTREQDTSRARKRLKDLGCPYERVALSFGDYSAKCTLPSGEIFDASNVMAVERKMDFDELCNCYCKDRPRFTREFERAEEAGAKVYLLVENADWEKAYKGEYRSKMSPSSLIASMLAWLARYNCQVLFCAPSTSGMLIHDILYRELKERLEALPDGYGK